PHGARAIPYVWPQDTSVARASVCPGRALARCDSDVTGRDGSRCYRPIWTLGWDRDNELALRVGPQSLTPADEITSTGVKQLLLHCSQLARPIRICFSR